MTKKIVVTGIGASSPLGGTAPDSWTALLAGESGAHTLTHEWVAELELPVTFAAEAKVRPDEVLERIEIKRLDPVEPVRADLGSRGLGGCRLPRDRPRAPRRRLGDRHRRPLDAARRLGHPQGEGPAPGAADDGADAHAERGSRRGQHEPRRARLRPHRRLGLRLEHRVDRERLRPPAAGLRRRHRRRRHRVVHPRHHARVVRVDAGAVASATTTRRPPRARTTSTATAS